MINSPSFRKDSIRPKLQEPSYSTPSTSHPDSSAKHTYCLDVRFDKPLLELNQKELENGLGVAICALLNTRRRGSCCVGVDVATREVLGVPYPPAAENVVRRAFFNVTTLRLEPPPMEEGMCLRIMDMQPENAEGLDKSRSRAKLSWRGIPLKALVVSLPSVLHLEKIYSFEGAVYRAGGRGSIVCLSPEEVEGLKAQIPSLRLTLNTYHVGLFIGNSSCVHSHTEFSVFSREDREGVRGYMGQSLCAFLNSPSGGVFDIGVTQRTGLVLGFVCHPDQQRVLSQMLDCVAHDQMSPHVMPDAYITRFVPVVKRRGVNSGLPDHFRVMEVHVSPGKNLFTFSCSAYRWNRETDALESINVCTPQQRELALIYRWARNNRDFWRQRRNERLRLKLAEVESYLDELGRRLHHFGVHISSQPVIRDGFVIESYV